MISLVCATISRGKDLATFLTSLTSQTFTDFEIIIVDQNNDNSLTSVLEPYKSKLDIAHIKTEQKGLSRARNIGIKHARYDIIGFPDDDCIYADTTLEFVKEYFDKNEHIDFIAGTVIDTNHDLKAGNLLHDSCRITMNNFMKTVMSASLFARSRHFQKTVFCEKLGAGTYFGSAEESDLAFHFLKNGLQGQYLPDRINIHHDYHEPSLSKEYQYALGLGAFLRKNYKLEKLLILKYMLYYIFYRPLGGMLIRPRSFARYYTKLKGRLNGFIEYGHNTDS